MLAGSRDHEEVDAQAFAGWGVDFLKYDNCWAPASDWVIDRYTAMSKALNKTGRPIVYSMCDWGVGNPWLWAPQVLTLLHFPSEALAFLCLWLSRSNSGVWRPGVGHTWPNDSALLQSAGQDGTDEIASCKRRSQIHGAPQAMWGPAGRACCAAWYVS